MKKNRIIVLFIILVVFAFSTVCFAQDSVDGNCFLKIDGVEGSCHDAAHERWLEIVDYTLKTETDKDGNEIPLSLTFTSRIEPAVVRLYDRYNVGAWFYNAKLDLTQVNAGRRTTVLLVELGKCKISSFDLVLLDDGTVAEEVTLLTERGASLQSGSIFGSGNMLLIVVFAAVVLGTSVFLFIRRKRKNALDE